MASKNNQLSAPYCPEGFLDRDASQDLYAVSFGYCTFLRPIPKSFQTIIDTDSIKTNRPGTVDHFCTGWS